MQLLQTGIAPAPHPVAEGAVVGLDIGPSTIAVVGDGSASLVKFCDTVIQPWTETCRLQRKMDRSKRATNPHCFNANGTAKREQKLSPSKRYAALRTEGTKMKRTLVAERQRTHGERANQILGQSAGHVDRTTASQG